MDTQFQVQPILLPPDLKDLTALAEVKVLQGHLEGSNVDPVDAMVEMIEIQRAYSAIQRSVLVMDDVLSAIELFIARDISAVVA